MPRVKSANPDVFAAVNVYDPDKGKQNVELYVRIETGPEGAKVGLAIDGSNSMKSVFAADIPPLFRRPDQNIMEPVVKQLLSFMRGLSGDGTTTTTYWAVGTGGAEIEPIGIIDEAKEATIKIEGPKTKAWGPGTKLAPALKYFMDQFKGSPWSMVLIITDGEIEDMDEVKKATHDISKECAAGKRGYVKFVIIGVGTQINVDQLEELNDVGDEFDLSYPDGDAIDMWDYSIAAEMTSLWEVVKEVNFGITLPGTLRVVDEKGTEVCSFTDGFPMKLEFDVPAGTKKVNIEVANMVIEQPLV